MRLFRLIMVLVPVAGLLSACSPAAEPIAGMAMRDGKPVVLFLPCEEFATVSVSRDYPDPHDLRSRPPAPSWGFITSDAVPGTAVELPLFDRPAAPWEIDEEELTSLEAGERYSLSGLSFRHAIFVHFTVDDLAALGADQVLTNTSKGKLKVVGRDAFASRARDGCGKIQPKRARPSISPRSVSPVPGEPRILRRSS
ncbi:hypothetical protein BJ973_001465 [Actinoplanes tereljensis]|uniref:Uncharacterized protein n=1 Tax=Paractinoplanes tereljensis TaxID=571912 RepID=A0A919TTQ8_9ACTN|nr:hypothetical protein [Actinoplanes tereljensis]GIF20630.1 hypothetical protein Ate02nite_33600 [Actinoplanes tereljensis]